MKAVLRPIVRPLIAPPPPAAIPGAVDMSVADRLAGDRFSMSDGERTYRCFFLSGCWRSGTHWVGNILNLHPKVRITGEFHFEWLELGYRKFTTKPWFLASRGPRLKRLAIESMERCVRQCLYLSSRDYPNAVWLGDRTPRHLAELLPGAPNFLLFRDGRDVLVSWSFHLLRTRHPRVMRPKFRLLARKWKARFKKDPDSFKNPGVGLLSEDEWVIESARAWAGFVRHDLAAAPRLRERGTPVHEIKYEQLWSDPENQRAAMYRFLRLDPAEAAPLSHETKTLPGFSKEDLHSARRKGVVGDWQNYFDERLRRLFKEHAGEELVRLGYEKDGSW